MTTTSKTEYMREYRRRRKRNDPLFRLRLKAVAWSRSTGVVKPSEQQLLDDGLLLLRSIGVEGAETFVAALGAYKRATNRRKIRKLAEAMCEFLSLARVAGELGVPSSVKRVRGVSLPHVVLALRKLGVRIETRTSYIVTTGRRPAEDAKYTG